MMSRKVIDKTLQEMRWRSLTPATRIPPPPKPLEYELVDLLGTEGIGEAEIEAIRIVLIFVTALRRKQAEERADSELEAITHDLERVMTRENRYLNALMGISNFEGPAAELASAALYDEEDGQEFAPGIVSFKEMKRRLTEFQPRPGRSEEYGEGYRAALDETLCAFTPEIFFASGIEAGTDETPQAAQPEGRESDPQGTPKGTGNDRG